MKAWCGEIGYFERVVTGDVVRYRSIYLHNDWTNILIRLSERITIHCVLTLISIREFHLWSSTCHGCVIFHTTAGHTVMRYKIWRCWPPQKATENDISTSIVVLCYLFNNTCTCFVLDRRVGIGKSGGGGGLTNHWWCKRVVKRITHSQMNPATFGGRFSRLQCSFHSHQFMSGLPR